MNAQKDIVTIRLNKLVNKWFQEEAAKQAMSKSELIRKVLTRYKEQSGKNE